MRKTRLLSLLALLMAVVTGARAQSTTHIVKQDNVNTIFNGGGYTLGNAVNAGDVLDFQGTIDLETAPHSLVINKPVNIISSTKDAVLKLHTPAGDRSGKNPGNTFVINADGAGTQVQDIRLENTGMWIFNTSNVTFTGVTFHVEGVPVCSGVGHVALRYSDNVTFDGCTVYTKNNGGNSACALTGSHDCTFKDTHFETAGSAGNVLYIGNPYNTSDMPAGYTMNNDNISVINCTFTAESSGAMSQFKIMDGLRHRIENCTVNFATGFGCTATASEDGHVIRNNTFTQGLSIPKASTVTGNSVTGNVSIYSNNATVSNTTVYLGSTITGNSILGKVTFSNNSKNNTLTRNVITSTGDYAVVMASTADANNTVQYNTLNAATKKGDEAVNPSTGTGNTISNNSNIALTLAEGTQDADKWSVKVGEEAAAFPVGGLKGGETITLQYTGRLKVKGVKATSDAAPAKTPATVTTAPTGAAIVGVGKSTALVSGGAADGGTLWYAVTTTNTKPASTDGFSDAVPTAKSITASGKVYVWYYVKGDDTHSDSEIAATAIEVPVADIVWDVTNVSDLRVMGTFESYAKEGVTLSANGEMNEASWRDRGDPTRDGIEFVAMESGGFTFTAPAGKKFTKIEMTLTLFAGWDNANLGTGWAYGEDDVNEIYTVTWKGSAAASTVGLLTGAGSFNGEPVKSIVFYLSE